MCDFFALHKCLAVLDDKYRKGRQKKEGGTKEGRGVYKRRNRNSLLVCLDQVRLNVPGIGLVEHLQVPTAKFGRDLSAKMVPWLFGPIFVSDPLSHYPGSIPRFLSLPPWPRPPGEPG